MKPFLEFEAEKAKKIEYLLCDIDDTITTKGKLTAEAYSALWNAHKAGIKVIPVTGRPAGWCDMIIRQWPVEAVIGENGAFVFYNKNDKIKMFTHSNVLEDNAQKLKEIEEKVLGRIPHTRVSKDQFSRKYDLAIDFNEDPPYLGLEVAEQIKIICVGMGAQAKVSSIHVNTWFGEYDKVSMAKEFFEKILGEENYLDKSIFFGDSPNDEPMFRFFKTSCAVANIKPFLDCIEYKPAYITDEPSGTGFTKAVAHLLNIR